MNQRDTKAQRFDYIGDIDICQRNQFRFQKLCFEHTLVINLLFSVSLRHTQDRLSASVVKFYE